MPHLDSDLLRTFLAIVEAGSVTRGAERIHRSQSATSLQLKQLEVVVGEPLVSRHGRGVVPTPAGERLIPVARQVTGMLDAALAGFRTDELAGRLRIGISEDVAREALADVLAAFCRDHPRMELDVHCALGDGFGIALKRGQLDLAVYEMPEIGPGQERMRTDRLVWMASRKHDVAARDPLPVAVFDRSCWWRDVALSDLSAAGRAYRTVFTSENASGVRAAVASGMAVALLSEGDRDTDLIALKDIAPPRPSYLVLDKAPQSRGPAVEALSNAIRRTLNEKPKNAHS
ncbi:LysR family transcriptional regulator [Plastorhodobacter daqingensis]|uniref:LysR family transcriptional regulator n=1 Tax=Plastorhodobacter daqingensis TaxID=1387281 RepID=A0ABW2UQU9_9RHOB